MFDFSEEEKREIDRQLREMKNQVIGTIGSNGVHLFPGLEQQAQEINKALSHAASLIEKLRSEIGYQEPTTQFVVPVSVPPSQMSSHKHIAPLRIMLVLKRDISAEDRAHVWTHITTPPGPGIDPMGIPANQAFKYALMYDRNEDAKAVLGDLEALAGVESANIIPSTF